MNMQFHKVVSTAFECRKNFLTEPHDKAFRLFNGFREGESRFVVDIFASTAVIHDYSDAPDGADDLKMLLTETFPWIHCVILKERKSSEVQRKNGVVVFGTTPDSVIREHGVAYAVELTMNRDNSFYPDTRNLRKWLLENMKGRSLLNTFAYTGTLGVAAMAAGASRVVQLDHSKRFLSLAKSSATLNALRCDDRDLWAKDFFQAVSKFKREKITFDCVILDPPFFSKTSFGTVDLKNDPLRLINKIRPLVNDGGTIININNALFLSGQEYLDSLHSICDDEYLTVREMIPIPEDFTCGETHYPVSPEPFNHSTKIALLDVRRKNIIPE